MLKITLTYEPRTRKQMAEIMGLHVNSVSSRIKKLEKKYNLELKGKSLPPNVQMLFLREEKYGEVEFKQ